MRGVRILPKPSQEFSIPRPPRAQNFQRKLLANLSCYQRVPFLRSVRARNVFVQILGQVRDRYEFSLVGYVVMPDHVHLLIGEPTRGTPSIVIQVLKQRVPRCLRRKKRAIAEQLNLNFESGTHFP